ncbi:hypothetical protein G6F56_002232 [Rhizopus delemar]|nr:hypothetical protein G6F56_002232 [Rhizopus delemar]
MFTYPFVIQLTFKYFEDPQGGNGLRRGVLTGVLLNTAAGCLRWLGAAPSSQGFVITFLGQTMAAIAQVFMLAVPPQLAVAWFPQDEVNLATSIAVSANNLGVGIGCALTPFIVKKTTSEYDIPNLMLIQFVLCLLAFGFIWISFKKSPPYHTNACTDINPQALLKQKDFICLLLVCGILMGGQCAIISLLAQIFLPPFYGLMDEKYVGILGSVMLAVGSIASLCVGCYLDRTPKYKELSRFLSLTATLTVMGLFVCIELGSLIGAIISCIGFGITSFAIVPTLLQFSSEIFYPINDIIPTGYLITAANVGGVLFVVLMGIMENPEIKFSMRLPMIFLMVVMAASILIMYQVEGVLNRTAQKKPLLI